VDRKLVVILGGEGKGQDFSPLTEPLAAHARALVLMGKDADVLAQTLTITGVPQHHASDMAQAVTMATDAAQTGDVVLLSPACASLDMYSNYAARAQAFVDAVQTLSMMEGQL
jgi:UDP-N-acetylmuramoylalanine--D-glutamate ligase